MIDATAVMPAHQLLKSYNEHVNKLRTVDGLGSALVFQFETFVSSHKNEPLPRGSLRMVVPVHFVRGKTSPDTILRLACEKCNRSVNGHMTKKCTHPVVSTDPPVIAEGQFDDALEETTVEHDYKKTDTLCDYLTGDRLAIFRVHKVHRDSLLATATPLQLVGLLDWDDGLKKRLLAKERWNRFETQNSEVIGSKVTDLGHDHVKSRIPCTSPCGNSGNIILRLRNKVSKAAGNQTLMFPVTVNVDLLKRAIRLSQAMNDKVYLQTVLNLRFAHNEVTRSIDVTPHTPVTIKIPPSAYRHKAMMKDADGTPYYDSGRAHVEYNNLYRKALLDYYHGVFNKYVINRLTKKSYVPERDAGCISDTNEDIRSVELEIIDPAKVTSSLDVF